MANELIPFEIAKKHTALYRQIGTSKAHGFFISKASIQALFEQDNDIDGIRIYNGIAEANGKFSFIGCVSATVPGADPDTHDDYLLPEREEELPEVLPKIASARPCPVICGKLNQLNS